VRRTSRALVSVGLLSMGLLVQSCKTVDIRPPSSAPQPATVRLSSFQAVELRTCEISPEFVGSRVNQRAVQRIDRALLMEMRGVFPVVQQVQNTAVGNTGVSTLMIEPYIAKVRFSVGGGSWGGNPKENSAVLMRVSFRDKSTGKVVAEGEFYRRGGATGGYGLGTADNLMLDNIAREIAGYVKQNL
jgi:hypothetical protein